MKRSFFVSYSGLACAESGLHRAVLRVQDRVPMNSKDVVDAADSQTLSEKGKIRLRALKRWTPSCIARMTSALAKS